MYQGKYNKIILFFPGLKIDINSFSYKKIMMLQFLDFHESKSRHLQATATLACAVQICQGAG